MNTATGTFLTVLGGGAVCGLFVLAHAIRTAVPLPEAEARAGRRLGPPSYPDRGQVGGGRAPVTAKRKRSVREFLATLRREEMRQRPWEGRN